MGSTNTKNKKQTTFGTNKHLGASLLSREILLLNWLSTLHYKLIHLVAMAMWKLLIDFEKDGGLLREKCWNR